MALFGVGCFEGALLVMVLACLLAALAVKGLAEGNKKTELRRAEEGKPPVGGGGVLGGVVGGVAKAVVAAALNAAVGGKKHT